MPYPLNVPLVSGTQLTETVEEGQTIFILGANGSGKSTLMQRLFSLNLARARRISAHRQTWFQSGALSVSANERTDLVTNIRNADNQTHSRHRDDYAAQRASVALYDLVDQENVQAREIADAVRAKDPDLAAKLAKVDAPIAKINSLLSLSNLPITIRVEARQKVTASKLGDGAPYDVAELSDGERNALLLAADVLTVEPGTLILIDEPERHLHRSIISPLLTRLFAEREDCAFVVSTHDVMLPIDNPSARVLLVRACMYNGGNVRWEADLVGSTASVPEDLRRAILGARRKVVFIEGTVDSLDLPVYSLLFPTATVVPSGSCDDVERAVSGVTDASDLHWVRAWGVIDNDRRTAEDIASLRTKGVFALPLFSVESIYFHPEIQRRVTVAHSAVTGDDSEALLKKAHGLALGAIEKHSKRLAERAAEKSIRGEVMRMLPGNDLIATGEPITIYFDVAKSVAAELERLNDWLAKGDLAALVQHYPIRRTEAPDLLAKSLGFKDRAQYQKAVVKLLQDSPDSLGFVRLLFGDLAAEIASA